MRVTAATITDEQLSALGRSARERLEAAREDLDAVITALTFHPQDGPAERKRRKAARVRCAAIWNARVNANKDTTR